MQTWGSASPRPKPGGASRPRRQYTVIDTAFEDSWRGQGPGVVRSSLDTLGGGWKVGPDGAGCEDALRAIETGVQQLSYRRLLAVESISPVRPR